MDELYFVNDIPLVYLIAACYEFQHAILSFVTTSTILEVIKGMDLRASKSPPTMHLVGRLVPNTLKDDPNPELIFSPHIYRVRSNHICATRHEFCF